MIEIVSSTNLFNQDKQTFQSILTGDLSDSKIVFKSDRYNNTITNEKLNNLKFKIELYFDDTLIFETYTPVLYNSGIYGISNIDLSRPIRDHLITQIGLTTSTDISDKYTAFKKINNTGKVIIKEVNIDVDVFDTPVEPDSVSDLLFWMDPSYSVKETAGKVIGWKPRVDNIGTYGFDSTGTTADSYFIKTENRNIPVIYHYTGFGGPSYMLGNKNDKWDSTSGMTIFTISKDVSGNNGVLFKRTQATEYYSIDNVSGSIENKIIDVATTETVSTAHSTDFILNVLSYDVAETFKTYFNQMSNKESTNTFSINDGLTDAPKLFNSSASFAEYMLGDIIVYNRRLTDVEIEQVQSYLIDKYEIFKRSYDTFIIKAVEKDFNISKYSSGTPITVDDNLIQNRFYHEYYNPKTNIIDTSNNIFYNNVYRSTPQLISFYNTLSGSTSPKIFEAYDTDSSVVIEFIETSTGTTNTTQVLEIEEDSINIYPNTSITWSITESSVTTTGTSFTDFNAIYTGLTIDIMRVSGNTETIYLKYNSKCSRFPHQIRWLNTLGGYDTFNFNLIHKEDLQTKDKGYYKNDYYITDTINDNEFKSSYQSYSKDFNKKYIFKTDWLTIDQIYLLEDLFKSNEIYLLKDDFMDSKTKKFVRMRNITKDKTLYHKDIHSVVKYEVSLEDSIKKEII